MAYKRIIIAVDCATPEEVVAVQAAAKRISEIFKLKAADVLAVYPIVEKNGNLIITTIRTIAQEGMRGAARMLPYLVKNLKR
jgi:hypothetical protein